MNCDGMPTPSLAHGAAEWSTRAKQVGADHEPAGRQEENTTSASAIQPRPAVMPGIKNGV